MPSEDRTSLPQVRAYKDLDSDVRAQVDKVLSDYCVGDAAKQAMIVGLEEFQDDVVMLLSMVGASAKQGHSKEGLWGALLPILQQAATTPLESTTKRIRAPRRKPAPKIEGKARGRLPFVSLPVPAETPVAFMERWLQTGRKYPHDMLEWSSGEINWLCKEVYSHKQGTLEWNLYLLLVTAHRSYDELVAMALDAEDKPFPQDKVDWAIKCFAVEPSWLPPGAGVYREDPETGAMWIARDPISSLEQTQRFAEVK